jgi:hypothetical protein
MVVARRVDFSQLLDFVAFHSHLFVFVFLPILTADIMNRRINKGKLRVRLAKLFPKLLQSLPTDFHYKVASRNFLKPQLKLRKLSKQLHTQAMEIQKLICAGE